MIDVFMIGDKMSPERISALVDSIRKLRLKQMMERGQQPDMPAKPPMVRNQTEPSAG